MSHRMLFVVTVLLAGRLWTPVGAYDDILVITSLPDVNVTLKCTAQMKPGLQYHAVRWYKETGVPRLSGLVSRALPAGQMRWYVGADTRISLEEGTLNLQLPTVTCSDQAVYQCYLAAPVGEQNREGRVRLSVTGCPTVTPAPTAEAEHHRPYTPQALPEPWTLPGDFPIQWGVAALLLCAFSIFLLSYRCLKKTLWTQTKTPGKDVYLDPNGPLEKQDLLWIRTLGPPPKKSELTAA